MTIATLTIGQYTTSAFTALLLLSSASSTSPVNTAGSGIRRILTDAEYRRWFLLATIVMILNLVETAFDDRLTAQLGLDFTDWLWRWEGALIAPLQQTPWSPAIVCLTFFYVIVFPTLMVSSMLLYAAKENFHGYRALLQGVVLNYLIVLPFLIFFPVREAWSGSSGSVALLINHLDPAIMTAYRSISALDNSFPSFHTSMSTTTALLAWRYGPRRFAWVVTVAAVLIITATLYLGIHWFSDVTAGLIVATVVYAITCRLQHSDAASVLQQQTDIG